MHTVEGLALYLGITPKTIYEWVKHKDKAVFGDIVEKVRDAKSMTLQTTGLGEGEFDSMRGRS